MSIVKNQHYVAQGYLSSWANADEQLFAFDKYSQKSFLSAVRNVASEKFFYDLPLPATDVGGDPQAIEKLLGQTVDADFPPTIIALLDGVTRHGRIDPSLKAPMGCFLAIQLMRTRSHRNQLTQLSESLLDELNRRGATPNGALDPEKLRLDEKRAARVQAQFFLDPAAVTQFAAVLGAHIWMVGTCKTARTFYTSDNPVVRKANAGLSGLASPGIQIAFPLTPKYILLLLERSFFSVQFAKYDLHAVNFTDRGVEDCNVMQVWGSHRQIYCQEDAFDLARDACKLHPEACDPVRVNVGVPRHSH